VRVISAIAAMIITAGPPNNGKSTSRCEAQA